MASAPPDYSTGMLRLPSEILLKITQYLSWSDRKSLRLQSREYAQFFGSIPRKYWLADIVGVAEYILYTKDGLQSSVPTVGTSIFVDHRAFTANGRIVTEKLTGGLLDARSLLRLRAASISSALVRITFQSVAESNTPAVLGSGHRLVGTVKYEIREHPTRS